VPQVEELPLGRVGPYPLPEEGLEGLVCAAFHGSIALRGPAAMGHPSVSLLGPVVPFGPDSL